MKKTAWLLAGLTASAAFLALPASGTMEMQKKAKAAGFAESTNCLYCHNEKLPRKGAVTNNERGQWLLDQQKKKGAKEIDFTWLKDFTPSKK